jgi:hypothetical protein
MPALSNQLGDRAIGEETASATRIDPSTSRSFIRSLPERWM